MSKAYTILEMAVVMAIITFIVAIGLPMFSRQIAESRFQAASADFTGHLLLARGYAQLTEKPLKLDFNPDDHFRYRVLVEERDGWRLLTGSLAGSAEIGLRLPATALPHPTTGKILTRALSSSHGQEIFFSAQGSSAATIVLSDGVERATCAVISSSSGRFRIYQWSAHKQKWKTYY